LRTVAKPAVAPKPPAADEMGDEIPF
jgi:hypothetical protein